MEICNFTSKNPEAKAGKDLEAAVKDLNEAKKRLAEVRKKKQSCPLPARCREDVQGGYAKPEGVAERIIMEYASARPVQALRTDRCYCSP